MGARTLLLFTHALLSYGLTVNRQIYNRDIISTSKTELTSLYIPCSLNDIIIISTPILYNENAQYHLYKPTGEIVILDIDGQGPINKPKTSEYSKVNRTKDDRSVITKEHNYIIINLEEKRDNLSEIEMSRSDFAIGPLAESDHGNWVLSAYCQDINGDWVELFQVITIEILENVPPKSTVTELKPGETFQPSFAYPIKGLQSCEIIAPRSTLDRYYDRNRINLDMCGYIIQNVTKADQGIWTLIGVGNIVYETKMSLNILD